MSEQTPQSQQFETPQTWETEPTVTVETTATEGDQETLNPIQETDWFTLARKLRQRNRELLQRAADLEQALATTQESLQAERRSSQQREQVTVQQGEELLDAQGQMSLLFQELEASHHVAQRQHVLIENLSQQLELAQAQIVRLEQECILARQTYTEQASLLHEAADNSQALRQHLDRQQSHTQQFQRLFSRYLEESEAGDRGQGSHAGTDSGIRADQPAIAPPSPITQLQPPPEEMKPSPIQPWSNQRSQPPTPPTWAARLFDEEEELAVEMPSAPATPAVSVFDAPAPAAAPPGKFANLNLPDFHAGRRSVMPLPRSQAAIQPRETPTPKPAPTHRAPKKVPSIAAVNLPSFPRVR
ncbi:hypothetical protein PN441_05300 [Spirulina major CS-329]|uniref:hypothetical protein n=1 Tax=Spirulina TaxID=1154 RepID=UPI00232C170B|nr:MULTISPECIES: hypothetical protein [Spirulina]MDB9495966.1 hypothetical protein [Spirulina subsalsa CS-330]MDB9502481.1 hypothetical protein [Spirulina major CS-329]